MRSPELPPKRRPSKRWEVETFVHAPSGETIAIHYDKHEKVFWAVVGPAVVERPTQVEAASAARSTADEVLQAEDQWARVILVDLADEPETHFHRIEDEDKQESRVVGFKCFRMWQMTNEQGHIYTRQWNRVPSCAREHSLVEMKRGDDVRRFSNPGFGDSYVTLPYTDEAWAAIEQLSTAIETARLKLEALVQSPQFLPKLLAARSKFALLEAPSTGDKDSNA